MDYASWMKVQAAAGASSEVIARAALRLPLASLTRLQGLKSLLQKTAVLLQIDRSRLHVVGSARYGFSLRDGAPFDRRFSNLDIAVIDPQLYGRCEARGGQAPGPRFPDLGLPVPEAVAFRRTTDDLSRLVWDRFAYVSITAYPNLEALVCAEAAKIRVYLNFGEAVTNDVPSAVHGGVFGRSSFAAAVRAGMPRFLGIVNESPAGKASPYPIDELGFRQAFATSATRRRLLDTFSQALSDIRCIVEVSCCLVGGSFVDPGRSDPGDIDMVVFYRALSQSIYEPGHALVHLTRKFKLRGVDARFVPCDAEPWLLVKMASFFTSLYHADREPKGHDRGIVLVIPDASPDREIAQVAGKEPGRDDPYRIARRRSAEEA